MSLTIQCPACEATIRPPGGRKDAITRCPWCGADLRPGAAPKPAADPSPGPKAEPPPAPAPEQDRPRRRRREPDEPLPAGGSQAVVALVILVVSAVLAVGAFFLARHLAGPSQEPDTETETTA
jgi:hypothetical protein